MTLAGSFSKTSLLFCCGGGGGGCWEGLAVLLPRRRGNVGCSGQPLLLSSSTHSCEPALRAYHNALRPSWSTIFTLALYWKERTKNL